MRSGLDKLAARRTGTEHPEKQAQALPDFISIGIEEKTMGRWMDTLPPLNTGTEHPEKQEQAPPNSVSSVAAEPQSIFSRLQIPAFLPPTDDWATSVARRVIAAENPYRGTDKPTELTSNIGAVTYGKKGPPTKRRQSPDKTLRTDDAAPDPYRGTDKPTELTSNIDEVTYDEKTLRRNADSHPTKLPPDGREPELPISQDTVHVVSRPRDDSSLSSPPPEAP